MAKRQPDLRSALRMSLRRLYLELSKTEEYSAELSNQIAITQKQLKQIEPRKVVPIDRTAVINRNRQQPIHF